MDDFTKAYIMAALWSSTDEDDSPLDANYGAADIAPSTLAEIIADCERFQTENATQLVDENCLYDGCPMIEYAGQDFWLTRNGHGCGFWDGDWEEIAGQLLTKSAHSFGEFNLYVGGDDLIYA